MFCRPETTSPNQIGAISSASVSKYKTFCNTCNQRGSVYCYDCEKVFCPACWGSTESHHTHAVANSSSGMSFTFHGPINSSQTNDNKNNSTQAATSPEPVHAADPSICLDDSSVSNQLIWPEGSEFESVNSCEPKERESTFAEYVACQKKRISAAQSNRVIVLRSGIDDESSALHSLSTVSLVLDTNANMPDASALQHTSTSVVWNEPSRSLNKAAVSPSRHIYPIKATKRWQPDKQTSWGRCKARSTASLPPLSSLALQDAKRNNATDHDLRSLLSSAPAAHPFNMSWSASAIPGMHTNQAVNHTQPSTTSQAQSSAQHIRMKKLSTHPRQNLSRGITFSPLPSSGLITVSKASRSRQRTGKEAAGDATGGDRINTATTRSPGKHYPPCGIDLRDNSLDDSLELSMPVTLKPQEAPALCPPTSAPVSNTLLADPSSTLWSNLVDEKPRPAIVVRPRPVTTLPARLTTTLSRSCLAGIPVALTSLEMTLEAPPLVSNSRKFT